MSVRDDNGGPSGRSRRREDNWDIELQDMLDGCVEKNLIGAGNIFRVPKEIREANKDKMDCYKPQFVAMGPFHRRTTIDLQTMEFNKWLSVDYLLRRPSRTLTHPCSMAIKEAESLIRACYGEEVAMASEQFSTMMLQDACFLLKLLLWLYGYVPATDPHQKFIPVYIDDHKKMSRLLTDLTLLENQIPFFLLILLSRILLAEDAPPQGQEEQPAAGLRALSDGAQLSPEKLARSLFQCDDDADFSKGVYHFLHLIHSCAPDPYHHQDFHGQAPLQLRRCARKLQALGINITCHPSNNEPVVVNVEPVAGNVVAVNGAPVEVNVEPVAGNVEPDAVNMASDATREFMDKFEFEIRFNETTRELNIPTLHIKEATEVKWRNFIAWEQMGQFIGVGYKFTSYAYFFKGLVCSVHDIQLLKEIGVIRVHTEAKDEDLLIMFQSIVTGAKDMDARYRQECEGLNKAKVNGVGGCCVLIFRMLWHYWRRFLEWLHRRLISLLRRLISLLRSFMHAFLGTPWKFIGVVIVAALLVLTIHLIHVQSTENNRSM